MSIWFPNNVIQLLLNGVSLSNSYPYSHIIHKCSLLLSFNFYSILMSQTGLNTGMSEMAQRVEHLTRYSKGQGSNPSLVHHYFFHPITGQFNNTCLIFRSNYNKLLYIFFIGKYSLKDLIYCKLYFASHLNCSLCLELSIENKLLPVLKWSTLSIIKACYITTLYCVKYSAQI